MRRDESFSLSRRFVLSAFLAPVFLGASLSDAQACSCAQLTLESRFESSANVFTAVVSIEYVEPADQRTPIRSLFRVTESFKGERPFLAFTSHPVSDSCGIDLVEGAEYLFFAPDSGEIGHCSGIVSTDRAGPEIEGLRSYVAGEAAELSVSWDFSGYMYGDCSLRTFFDFGDGFGQGSLVALASNERSAWARNDPQFSFTELAIHLRHRFPASAGETRSPIQLIVGNGTYTAEWTHGRTFDQETPHDGTVRASLPDAYVLLGNEVEDLLQRLTVSDALIVRFNGEGLEPNRDLEVRTAYLADDGPDMLACIQDLRGQ